MTICMQTQTNKFEAQYKEMGLSELPANGRAFRVECHTAHSLRVMGGETLTSWGAPRKQVWLTRAEAWKQAQAWMAEDPSATVKVSRYCFQVWSNW